MRLFRGLSTLAGDKPGRSARLAGGGMAAPRRDAPLGEYCAPAARPWRQREFCGCAQAVLSLIHISRGQPGAWASASGPFLTTPCRCLMCKGKAELPSSCPHACPQNAGTNAQDGTPSRRAPDSRANDGDKSAGAAFRRRIALFLTGHHKCLVLRGFSDLPRNCPQAFPQLAGICAPPGAEARAARRLARIAMMMASIARPRPCVTRYSGALHQMPPWGVAD